MTKSLTEKWKDGELPKGVYYIIDWNGKEQIDYCFMIGEFWFNSDLKEVLAPVPSYESLYNPNDGMSDTTGLFTVLKIIKRDIELTQEYRDLTALECGIKSQVVSLLKKWGIK